MTINEVFKKIKNIETKSQKDLSPQVFKDLKKKLDNKNACAPSLNFACKLMLKCVAGCVRGGSRS